MKEAALVIDTYEINPQVDWSNAMIRLYNIKKAITLFGLRIGIKSEQIIYPATKRAFKKTIGIFKKDSDKALMEIVLHHHDILPKEGDSIPK